jgi:hypothetical protein
MARMLEPDGLHLHAAPNIPTTDPAPNPNIPLLGGAVPAHSAEFRTQLSYVTCQKENRILFDDRKWDSRAPHAHAQDAALQS